MATDQSKDFCLKSCSSSDELTAEQKRKDANTCILLGTGVGALGAGTALAVGAACPLCFIVSPALIGFGLIQRFQARLGAKQ